jgi:membrane protein implicated in regulation of membrane protease activity
MDERQAAKLSRAVLIYGLSLMVSGMATAMITYILLPIEVVFGIAAVVALISTVIGIRAYRTLKALAKSQTGEAKSALDEPSSRSS